MSDERDNQDARRFGPAFRPTPRLSGIQGNYPVHTIWFDVEPPVGIDLMSNGSVLWRYQ